MPVDIPRLRTVVADYLGHGNPFTSPKPLTDADLRKAYQTHPPITDKLPWIDLIGDQGSTVLLDDGISVGTVFLLQPLAVEGRSEDFLVAMRDALTQFVRESCDCLPAGQSPWVMTLYAKNEKTSFRSLTETVRGYARNCQSGASHRWTEHYMDHILGPHIEDMAADQGLFVDEYSDHPWGGQVRELNLVVYRRVSRSRKQRLNPEEALENVCRRIVQNLRAASIEGQRMSGEDIRVWLARWLNPRPHSTNGDVKRFCEQLPPLDPVNRPYDWCLADDVTSRTVRSDAEQGIWYLDEIPHTLLTTERLRSSPVIGQLSAERILGGESGGARARGICLLDRLPAGATLILTWTPVDQSIINRHLDRIDKSAKAETAEAEKTQESSQHSRRAILDGNLVFPWSLAVALRAEDEDELARKVLDTEALMTANNLQIINPDYDSYRLDSWLRHLPMCYDVRLDQVRARSRWIFTQHLANLLPLYGRGRGTGKPGLVFYNRGGEPFMADPLSLRDRAKNAHLFLFGPTGAGKSATLVYLIMHYLAVYRPRIIIVEAGNSFGLLTDYLSGHGLITSSITLKPGCGASIPVFRDALALLDDQGEPIDFAARFEEAGDEEITIDQRDYLGEMMLKARLMITGGRASEEVQFSRSDEAAIREAIIGTAKRVFRQHGGQSAAIVSDVVATLGTMADQAEGRQRDRLNEMARSMEMFCSGFEGELFNARHSSWNREADVTRVEMATLTAPNYSDRLALAYIGLINEAMAMAEANQADGRPTIMLTDEGHVITTNPITAAYKVLISKLSGRRMGFWLWDATQNLEDYPDEAEKMLSMFEWWMCLNVGRKELDDVLRFRALSTDEQLMALGTRKVSGLYTEGCVLSDKVVGQFRHVPPALALALAQTEKEERSRRAQIMREQECSELEAVEYVAREIAEQRRGTSP